LIEDASNIEEVYTAIYNTFEELKTAFLNIQNRSSIVSDVIVHHIKML